VAAVLDQWETAPGDLLPEFMGRGIKESDFVLIICTPEYKRRSEGCVGGVSYEGSIITGEIVTGQSRRKFIPLLRGHEWTKSSPDWLLGAFYIDLRGEPYNENAYQEILDTLLERREKAPSIGTPPVSMAPRSVELVDTASSSELANTENDTWPYLWKRLRDLEPYDPELLQEGKLWLRRNGRLGTEAWSFVWEDIARADPYDPELVYIAHEWLRSHPQHAGWSFIWRRLTELDPYSPELIELGKRQLRRVPG
jgi:hypothetical protein